MEQQTEQHTIQRRTFLKVAATAVATAGASAGASGAAAQAIRPILKPAGIEQHPYTERTVFRPEDALAADRWVRNGCAMCPTACMARVQVRGGRVVNVQGEPKNPPQSDELNPQDAGLCPKGLIGTVQLMYNRHRILRPLRRVGPKPSLEFEPITWDQAYRDVARKLLEIRDTHGPAAIAAKGSDRANRDGITALLRFGAMLGSSNFTHEGYV